jgi:histidinol-phosphate/aromatic aminotransferase/cobyric acid decarboxylase-like protein
MNFAAYKTVARDILASASGSKLLRLDCMNPVKALDSMRPALRGPARSASPRELEECWRSATGLLDAPGHVVLATGVRPLLSALFAWFARDGRRLHAPADVYPVYLDSARRAGLDVTTFPTVPVPMLPTSALVSGPEVMLIPEPLVPLGRPLSGAETAHISSWLEEDRRRLLVLDCVYTFSSHFTQAAQALLSSGQTILLHSLAKAFLTPDTAGFAIGPHSVLESFEHRIPHEAVATAVRVLNSAPNLPSRLNCLFAERWARMAVADIATPATGYFAVAPLSFDSLLARGHLAVPGSTFGASTADWCAVTCLLADADPSHG